MVTEGGLYILTLFDDFGGTYGKSHFGLGLETGLSLSLKWEKSSVTPTQTPTQKFINRFSKLGSQEIVSGWVSF